MSIRLILVIAACGAVLTASGDVTAQTVGTATGSIVGTVTDTTGAVLLGVTVTATSPALMGDRAAVTNPQGRYRFAALPPAEYKLSFRLPGFAISEPEPVRVGVGFTASLDVVLAVDALSEDVTVPARSGVLDRHATAVSYFFEWRELAALPTGRDMSGQLAATPGVEPTDVLAYGTRGTNRPTVEGILVTGIRSTSFRLDDGAFEEVSVATAAHGPSFATPGVHQQSVSKSGGNQYRGTVYAEHQNGRWQSINIDAQQISRGAQAGGANRLDRRHDVNADLGGFIVKNRLWWYSSVRDQAISERLVNLPADRHGLRVANYTGKGTYRISPGNTFSAFGQRGWNSEPNRLEAFLPTSAIHETEASTANERGGGWVWKGEWNSTVRDTLLFEVRFGQFGAHRHWIPNSAAPRVEDTATLTVHGGNRDWSRGLRRNQLFATVSHFSDGRTGTHHLKAGVEVFRWTEGETWRMGYPGNAVHVFSNGTPAEVILFQTPSRSESGLWTYAAHAADSWQVNTRLTVNFGLRFDRNRVFLPAQQHPLGSPTAVRFEAVRSLIAWNTLVPRVGAVYNLTGSHPSLVKVSYGRYRLPPGLTLGANANPNSLVWWSRYRWADLNENGTWDAGEEFGSPLATRGGVELESVDPETTLAAVGEFAVWLEKEIGGTAFRTGAVRRSARQFFARHNASWPFDAFNVPVVLQDPGPDGSPGNADDGPQLTAVTLPPERLRVRAQNVVRNVPDARTDYWTWEVAAVHRLRGRWSMTASFAHTWHRDHAAGYAGQTVRNNVYPLTPNDLINTGAGGAHEFTTWTVKAYGTYAAPLDLRITPVLQHYSGQPFGRTFETNLGYARVVVLAEPIGTRRMDHMTNVDLRVEKGIPVTGSRRLAVFIDVLNLFNSNAETGVSWRSGPDFLRPLTIAPPRIANVGLKFAW